MSAFQWNGDDYPLPPGFQGLSVEDWYHRMETIRDRQMNVHEVDLEPLYDSDGDELDPEEVLLIREYGFLHGGHWEAFRNWSAYAWAQQTGEDPASFMVRMSGIARDRIMADKQAAMAGPGGGLSPVEGISLEQWAHIQAALASGGDLPAMLAQAGIDQPRWDRVSAEWMARMQTDTTMAIATAYGNAFAGAGQGQYGAQAAQAAQAGVAGNVGDEPVPFERFVQIQEAMSAGSQRGHDPTAILAEFGVTPADFGNIGAYWSRKIQQEAMKYHALMTEYSAKYKAMYGG